MHDREPIILAILATVFGTLGVVCSAITAFAFAFRLNPRQRSFPHRMLIWLSLADLCQGLFFMSALPLLLATRDDSIPCMMQGLFGVACALIQFCWNCCMSVTVFFVVLLEANRIVNKQAKPFDLSILEPVFHIVSVFVPGAVTIIVAVVARNVVDLREPSAWCGPSLYHRSWAFGVFFVPLYGTIVFIVLVYAAARRKVRRIVGKKSSLGRTKLLLIPFAFCLTRLPDAIMPIVMHANASEQYLFAVRVGIAVLAPSQGVINAWLFLFSSPITMARCLGYGQTPRRRHQVRDLDSEDNNFVVIMRDGQRAKPIPNTRPLPHMSSNSIAESDFSAAGSPVISPLVSSDNIGELRGDLGDLIGDLRGDLRGDLSGAGVGFRNDTPYTALEDG